MIVHLAGQSPGVHPAAWVAPGATVVGEVRLGANVGVWYGGVLRGDGAPIEVGELTNLQDGCVLHSDPDAGVTIGREVTVGHRAILHGCRIADRVLIGMGAIVMTGAEIETGCIIGAGALVPEGVRIPADSLVLGSPGRVRRPTTRSERDHIARSAQSYLALLIRHRDDSGPVPGGPGDAGEVRP